LMKLSSSCDSPLWATVALRPFVALHGQPAASVWGIVERSCSTLVCVCEAMQVALIRFCAPLACESHRLPDQPTTSAPLSMQARPASAKACSVEHLADRLRGLLGSGR
jgi:hypothetical protein